MCKMTVPKGFLPTLFFSLFFLSIPLALLFQPWEMADSTAMSTRVLTVGAATLGGLFVILANECVAWFNMALFFHIGVEIKVLQTLADFAQHTDTLSGDSTLGWIAFIVILVHLLPFLVSDRLGLLTLLAYVGLVVNTIAVLYTDYPSLLLVSLSSGMLLGSTLLIAGIDCIDTSILSTLRKAMKDNTWLVCSPFEA